MLLFCIFGKSNSKKTGNWYHFLKKIKILDLPVESTKPVLRAGTTWEINPADTYILRREITTFKLHWYFLEDCANDFWLWIRTQSPYFEFACLSPGHPIENTVKGSGHIRLRIPHPLVVFRSSEKVQISIGGTLWKSGHLKLGGYS